jgi:hypothetical protein
MQAIGWGLTRQLSRRVEHLTTRTLPSRWTTITVQADFIRIHTLKATSARAAL